jgi:hypothetical protein
MSPSIGGGLRGHRPARGPERRRYLSACAGRIPLKLSEIETSTSLDVDTNAAIDDVWMTVRHYTANRATARMFADDTASC